MWCEGVMRVAHIDMRNTFVNCPTPLTQYELDSGKRMCGSTNSLSATCDSVIFPTHHFSYQHVCGKAAGFSYYHPCHQHVHVHAIHISRYDNVHNNIYIILGSVTQRARLHTAASGASRCPLAPAHTLTLGIH